MALAKYFMSKISDYLKRKYRDTKNDKHSQFDAMSFIEYPHSKFEDPFKDNPKKKAYRWQARAYKTDVPFPLPRKSIYDGPMNYFEIVHGPSRRTESDNNIHEYVFVCYDDSLDVFQGKGFDGHTIASFGIFASK